MSRDWSKTMLRGSYKGVPFYVDKDQIIGGRRISVHEFTNRDNPFNEDLGGRYQAITVEGYVHGDLADAKGSELFVACTSKGAGPLSLPLLGINSVRCDSVKLSNDYRRLGVIKISMQFVKDYGLTGGLKARINPIRNVQVLAAQARSVVSDAFSARYSIQSRIGGRATSLAMAAVADEINMVAGLGLIALEGVVSAQPVYAAVNRAAVELAENADIYSRQISSFSDLRRISSDTDAQPVYAAAGKATNDYMALMNESVSDKRGLFLSISETILAISPADELDADLVHPSVTRRTSAKLLSDYRTAARQAMAISAMQAAGEAAEDIASRRDARFIRARMGDITDKVIAEVKSQDELAILTELRGAAANALKSAPVLDNSNFQNNLGRDENNVGNASEIIVSVNKQLPATYWGWRLYSDPSRAEELIERNDVPHPSFMPYEFEALTQ